MNNLGKTLACCVVLALHIAISLFGAFILMVGMNGFISSNIPGYGFLFFFIWGIVTAIILTVSSYIGVGFMADKQELNQYLAAAIAIVVSTILSAIIMFIGLFASLALVSFLAS